MLVCWSALASAQHVPLTPSTHTHTHRTHTHACAHTHAHTHTRTHTHTYTRTHAHTHSARTAPQVRTTTEVGYLEPPPVRQPLPTQEEAPASQGPLGPGLRYVALIGSGDPTQVGAAPGV